MGLATMHKRLFFLMEQTDDFDKLRFLLPHETIGGTRTFLLL